MKRALVLLVACVTLFLLVRVVRGVDPRAVADALREFSGGRLAAACVLTVTSYATLTLFDWGALKHLGIALKRRSVALVSFISYACNFNFGVLLGGLGVRLRLYGKIGLSPGDVARVSVYALTASVVAFLIVAGIAHALYDLPPALASRLPAGTARVLAAIELLVGLGYLVLCWLRPGVLRVKRWRYRVPDLAGVAPQLGPAFAQWLLTCGVLYFVLPERAGLSFADAVAIQTTAAIFAVLAHVPAGLGAFEATLIAMVPLPREEVLASAVAYRAIYHLAPLAATAWLIFERGRMHEPSLAHT
jgi:uncharacterized membrane protein YbhN (UPF0104 family)